ncbi:DUF4194 domain-containing protein [Frigoribacterium sp. 2-23]|uniref:DUF4194 domain-containing protein n=1 Tax=Frigoribacterium sp. 2-23 TaxID=3415006 RepID=UPI003C702C8E
MTPATPTDATSGRHAATASSATASSATASSATASSAVADPFEADGEATPAGDEFPLAARKALVTLLTHRFVSRSRQGEAWSALLTYEPEIRARLAEMFLVLIVDREHEVAFKRQSGEDDVPILLRREKPMSRDASLLLVFLRREHAYADAQDEAVVVTRDQVAEFLSRYHDDVGQDEVRSMRRVDAAITAMVNRDLLEPESDDPQLFTVAPAIVPLVTADQLAHLEAVFLTAAGEDTAIADEDEGPESDVDVESDTEADTETALEPDSESDTEPDPALDVPLDGTDPEGTPA